MLTEMMVSSPYDVIVKKKPAGRCVNFRNTSKMFFFSRGDCVCLLSNDAMRQFSAVEEVQVEMEMEN